MLMANKCDAPIRCAEPVCQSENDCVTQKQHQACGAGDMRHVHDHHHPQVYEQKKHQQQNQSHMTPSLPPRPMAPPNVRLAHAQAQADAANTRPMRAAKAPPLPFMDEMDADSESMAQFRRRFDGGEFFLAGDRAAQLSRSA